MNFIELTVIENDKTESILYIRLDEIHRFGLNNQGNWILLYGHNAQLIKVKEMPNEILSKIKFVS